MTDQLDELERLAQLLEGGKISNEEYERLKSDLLGSSASDQTAPPGWYRDPAGVATHEAYWDGEKWTGATRPGPSGSGSRRWVWLIVILVLVGVVVLAVVAALVAVQLAGNEVTETFSEIGSELDFDSAAPGISSSLTDEEELVVVFLRDWSAEQPYLTVVDRVSDDELIEMGRSACTALDSGTTVEDLYLAVIAEVGADDEEALTDVATIIGAGVGAFCPEHSDQLG